MVCCRAINVQLIWVEAALPLQKERSRHKCDFITPIIRIVCNDSCRDGSDIVAVFHDACPRAGGWGGGRFIDLRKIKSFFSSIFYEADIVTPLPVSEIEVLVKGRRFPTQDGSIVNPDIGNGWRNRYGLFGRWCRSSRGDVGNVDHGYNCLLT